MFGVMFWLTRYPLAEACGKKPDVASRCMERMARWSAAAALIFRLCSRARFTAWSMLIAPSSRGREFVPAVAAPVASATPSQAPSIERNQSDEESALIRSAVVMGVPHLFTWSPSGISSRSVRLGPRWR